MPDDDAPTEFFIRFEGGPFDGQTHKSGWDSPEQLPKLLLVNHNTPKRALYELAMFSRLPPIAWIVRGATYRHVPEHEEREALSRNSTASPG